MEFALTIIAGLVVVCIIALALLGLARLEDPVRKAQRAKEQILKEMLASAKTDEERNNILRMAQDIEAAPLHTVKEEAVKEDEEEQINLSSPKYNPEDEMTEIFDGTSFAKGLFADFAHEEKKNGETSPMQEHIITDSDSEAQNIEQTMELDPIDFSGQSAQEIDEETITKEDIIKD